MNADLTMRQRHSDKTDAVARWLQNELSLMAHGGTATGAEYAIVEKLCVKAEHQAREAYLATLEKPDDDEFDS